MNILPSHKLSHLVNHICLFHLYYIDAWCDPRQNPKPKGVLESVFDRVCSRRSETPCHIWGFFSLKKWQIWLLFGNLQKLWLNSKGFSPQEQLILKVFCNFHKMGPSLKEFLTKMGCKSKIFLWKTNPFGWHIPIFLNMWVPHWPQPWSEATYCKVG